MYQILVTGETAPIDAHESDLKRVRNVKKIKTISFLVGDQEFSFTPPSTAGLRCQCQDDRWVH